MHRTLSKGEAKLDERRKAVMFFFCFGHKNSAKFRKKARLICCKANEQEKKRQT